MAHPRVSKQVSDECHPASSGAEVPEAIQALITRVKDDMDYDLFLVAFRKWADTFHTPLDKPIVTQEDEDAYYRSWAMENCMSANELGHCLVGRLEDMVHAYVMAHPRLDRIRLGATANALVVAEYQRLLEEDYQQALIDTPITTLFLPGDFDIIDGPISMTSADVECDERDVNDWLRARKELSYHPDGKYDETHHRWQAAWEAHWTECWAAHQSVLDARELLAATEQA